MEDIKIHKVDMLNKVTEIFKNWSTTWIIEVQLQTIIETKDLRVVSTFKIKLFVHWEKRQIISMPLMKDHNKINTQLRKQDDKSYLQNLTWTNLGESIN